MDLTPAQRALRARAAAYSSWARTPDRTARTQAGRDAFMRRFEDQVDPERALSDDERLRRAEQAKKAHFAQLALKSSRARQRARGNGHGTATT
jgi:hypothetical protein